MLTLRNLHRFDLEILGLFIVLFLGTSQICFGQAAAMNGQIEGSITDPNGAVVVNAKVEALNTGTGYRRTAQTDESGFFRFTVLPLGAYEVSAEASGFSTAKRSNIVINAGTTATLNIQLSVAGVSTEVNVTAASPIVEPGRTDLGSTLSTNQVENLPLVSRNPYNFILVQPNVSGHPNTEFGVPRKVNANGFTDRINYQLDGSNNTQSDRAGIRLLPISNTYVAEIQQVNNGFAPEFGNTAGTVYNAITRSGSNEIHGEGAYIFRRTGFNARPTLLSPTAPKPEQKIDSAFADVGGPIVKDKLFFFGAFENVRRDLPQAVTVSPATVTTLGLPSNFANAVPFSQKIYFFIGKVDYQINLANRLSVRYNYFRNESPFNNAGGLTVQSQSYLFKDRAYAIAAQLISTLSSNAVNEFRFQLPQRNQRQVAFDATGTQPAITISGLINFGGSEQVGFHFTERTPEWSDNFSYNWKTHSFKVGGTLRNIRDKNVSATFARYTFPNLAAYQAASSGTNTKSYTNFTQTFGEPEINYQSLFSGFYFQDNWKLRPNLTLIYGVRYDVYKIPSADSSSLFPASKGFKVDKNNFAPRIGIAYALGKEQKTVIRVSSGIFYDAPQTDIYRRAILNNGSPRFFNISTSSTTAFAPAFPNIFTAVPTGFNLPVQDITTVATDFSTLYSTNFNIQVSHELTPDVGVSASYLFTKGTHIPVYRNINLIPTGSLLADGRPVFGSGRVFSQFNNILMAESVGSSSYNGMNLTLNRRYSHGYELFATYTYSHAIDDTPEQNVLDSSNLLPEDPTNRRRDRGNALTDRRHVVTISGVLTPKVELDSKPLAYFLNNNRFAFIFTGASGDVFNQGGSRNLNGDNTIPSSLQRPLFIGRNQIRGPKIYQMDFRYARLFPLRERIKAEFLAEFTNIFNHPNITGLNTTTTVDANGFITTPPSLARTASLDQRLMQLGFRVTF